MTVGLTQFPQWSVQEVNTWTIPSVMAYQTSSASSYYGMSATTYTIEPQGVENSLRALARVVNENAAALRECQEFVRWIAISEPEALDRWRASLVAERLTA